MRFSLDVSGSVPALIFAVCLLAFLSGFFRAAFDSLFQWLRERRSR